MRQHHADGNAFTVQQAARIAGVLFQRMAKSVPQIEQGANSGFLLVRDHHPRLVGTTAGNRLAARRPARKDLDTVGFEPLEEFGVVDQPIFDHLGIAGSKLARIKRIDAEPGEIIATIPIGYADGYSRALSTLKICCRKPL